MSMHIYSSVSGTVSSVEQILYNAGENDTVVVISPDGTQTPDPDIRPPEVHDLDSFVGALEHSGIVGLGGAGFPTDVKVRPKNLSEIDTLLINGAECEPYLTTDNREFLECATQCSPGFMPVLIFWGFPVPRSCIEDNKPEAIRLMRRLCRNDSRISIWCWNPAIPKGRRMYSSKTPPGARCPGAHGTPVLGS